MFSSADNSTLIIAIKGTSAAILGGGGPTATRDKINVSCFLLFPFAYGWGLVDFRFCLLRFVICNEKKEEKGGKGWKEDAEECRADVEDEERGYFYYLLC